MRQVRFLCVALVGILAVSLCSGQVVKKMSNQDVIEMVGLGLPNDVVITKITSAETDFDTSLEGLKALKAAKVSDEIIRVMVNPHAAPSAKTAPATTSDAGLPDEVGVYAMVKGKLTEVEPEVVGWQTGGFMKSMATGGLTKGHINGKIMKPKSALQATTPIEFLIKTPEGTSVTEYQLLRLDEKGDRREFRAMTGGIIHASGGAEKNAVAFEPEKIASRVWRITIKDLKKGEYGFLPPGVNSSSISSAGKIYTFGVME